MPCVLPSHLQAGARLTIRSAMADRRNIEPLNYTKLIISSGKAVMV